MKKKANEPALAYLLTTNWQNNILDYADLIAVSRNRISASQLEKLRLSTGLEIHHLAKILQITTRTLQNKKGDD